MHPAPSLTFIGEIPAITSFSTEMNRLTLQDLRAGGFTNPLEQADPNNAELVAVQQRKLRKHPTRYCGYVDKSGKLVAYLKQASWDNSLEAPFARLPQAAMLYAQHVMGLDARRWGVLGLVASDRLSEKEREYALTGLLQYAVATAQKKKMRSVNLPLHPNDPLLQIAPKFGFAQVGKLGELEGAPGVKQRRFQLLVK